MSPVTLCSSSWSMPKITFLGPVFDGFVFPLKTTPMDPSGVQKKCSHVINMLFLKKKKLSQGVGRIICVHSQWAVFPAMPEAATDEKKKNDLQSCGWSASREQFGGWRSPCD